MEVLGTAVGVASLGIQVCQGLLTYYDIWKTYDSDISDACRFIAELSKTFSVLQGSLKDPTLDKERAERVSNSLQSCSDALIVLSARAQKLRKHIQPVSTAQRVLWQTQRLQYPFRAKTLSKLKANVGEIQSSLQIALQVLQLDMTQQSQKVFLDLRQSQQLRTLVDWLSPSDPWTNHASASQRRQPYTGEWLLKSHEYQDWKLGNVQNTWLYGKPGCGKTILCSSVIEDVRTHCEGDENFQLAAFYFTFSEQRKQSYEDLLRSISEQLGSQEPGLSLLQQAYEECKKTPPRIGDLEKLVITSAQMYKTVYIVLDALDESPSDMDARYEMLQGLERLIAGTSSIKVLATSRELRDIRETMEIIQAQFVPIATSAVDADIELYVSQQLSQDRRLSRVSEKLKTLIQKTISSKADGMFRWAYCQLLELKQLKSTRRQYIEDALNNLPTTLDDTYERMLTSIEQRYHGEALSLLRWLAFSFEPLTLAQLTIAGAILESDAEDINYADLECQEDFEGPLDILAGLVLVIKNDETNEVYDGIADDDSAADSGNEFDSEAVLDGENKLDVVLRRSRLGPQSKIRLAHFSVKEYLISSRIITSTAQKFHLDSRISEHFLAQTCITYLLHYAGNDLKSQKIEDLSTFPLLEYAAKSWYIHFSQGGEANTSPTIFLLSTESIKLDWLRVCDPEQPSIGYFALPNYIGPALYYASTLGLERTVQVLLDAGADVNATGGHYGNALQAASLQGYESLVRVLLGRGADVNAEGGTYGTALQAASFYGYEKIVQILLDAGANINASAGLYNSALQAASRGGHERIVRKLLDMGADVNSSGGAYGDALAAAGGRESETIARILLDAGADVKVNNRALQTASSSGHVELVRILLDAGADVHAYGRRSGNSLQAASGRGREDVVRILLDAGADVNAPGYNGTALQLAAANGEEIIVQILLDAGAKVNAHGSEYHGDALVSASRSGHESIVRMLLGAGADVNSEGRCNNAISAAALYGHTKIIEILLDAGANVNAGGRNSKNALQTGLMFGHRKAVKTLLKAGAIPNGEDLEAMAKLRITRSGGQLSSESEVKEVADDEPRGRLKRLE